MYGITDYYFQTLHDFNTFGERLEAFLPEQAFQGEVHPGFHVNVLGVVHVRRKA